MKHLMRRLLAVLLCVLLAVFGVGFSVTAEEQAFALRVQRIREGIVAYHEPSKDAQAWINGDLSIRAGEGAEWNVLALAQTGIYDFSAYEASLLSYLEEHTVSAASTRQKLALCLSAVGSRSGYISRVMEDSIGQAGLMSYVFGLHLLNNGYTGTAFTKEAVVEQLLSLQVADGADGAARWGICDMTAMTVQALAPYYSQDAQVKNAIDKALLYLSQQQNADGDYTAYGADNPETTSQVVIALCSLGIDPFSDARFLKNGNTLLDGIEKYRNSDGGFSHRLGEASNQGTSSQVFLAMSAYERLQRGCSPIYLLDLADPSGVEPAPDLPSNGEGSDVPVEPAPESAPAQPKGHSFWSGYKPWAILGILAVGMLVCALLGILKKAYLKNLLVVAVLACVAIGVVLATNIRSAEDYYNLSPAEKQHVIGEVTMTIRCDRLVGVADADRIPLDGVILEETAFELASGETIYDLLTEAARTYRLQVEHEGTAQTAYVTGIAYLYAQEFGELSGWTCFVNGVALEKSCGAYVLEDGDSIEWHYSLALGNDILPER